GPASLSWGFVTIPLLCRTTTDSRRSGASFQNPSIPPVPQYPIGHRALQSVPMPIGVFWNGTSKVLAS
ncbi:hypothetical protein, partial [Acetobacter sp. DsW_059]|uniref:hypothetical protein n=1 Tax=Acetobacter sp. DsW_059 TaxID=1670661 RepID=UPI0013029022